MKVFAVMMVKDEIDVLPFVIQNLLADDIDAFYIADNNSTDGTRDYLSDLAKEHKNVTVIDDPEVGYYQQVKMNRWINQAVEKGAEIILPVDADEFWYPINQELSLGDALRKMEADVAVGYVIDMVPQPSDENTGNPLKDMVYRELYTEIFPCVAYKYHPNSSIAQGNHDVSHPGVRDDKVIEIRHFQYRSLEHYKRKLRNGKAAYDATDLPEGFGAHWRQGGALSDAQLEADWTAYINQQLIYDPAPLKVF